MIDQIAAQADALVDIQYYMLNCAAKKGINMSSLFGVVHAANMAKRNPETGRFEKRADGKIIKPPGWQPPDVEAEVRRQCKEGAWTALVLQDPASVPSAGYPTQKAAESPSTPLRVSAVATPMDDLSPAAEAS